MHYGGRVSNLVVLHEEVSCHHPKLTGKLQRHRLDGVVKRSEVEVVREAHNLRLHHAVGEVVIPVQLQMILFLRFPVENHITHCIRRIALLERDSVGHLDAEKVQEIRCHAHHVEDRIRGGIALGRPHRAPEYGIALTENVVRCKRHVAYAG